LSTLNPRKLLVVVYAYPPSLSVAAVRWSALTKYLAEMGHSVTVVTSDAFGAPVVADAAEVHRPRSLETVWPYKRPHLNPRVSWAPFALRETRRLLRADPVDCLITSSPPESAHLVGLMLGRRVRPPWIADFRDGWCFEPYMVRFRTSPQLAIDRWFEKRVARAADLVVGVTPPIADDLTGRLGAESRWVSNGWDPAEVGVGESAGVPKDEPGVLKLVYTGQLWGPRGRTPEPFFQAMRRVASEADAPRLRLIHAGTLVPEDQVLIDRTGVSDLIEHVGLLDRTEVLALQRSGDVLVLITSADSQQATGKLFEYLSAGKPILALADGNEAERLVRETGTGAVVPPNDVDAIAEALRSAARGDLARAYAPHGVDQYAYPHLAEQMADVIEQAIAAFARA
jgi:glycosyltransferase involved in cell wall biosynthesis